MAEKKTIATSEEKEETTEKIFIPLTGAPNEPETEFFSVNERTFYVRKGEWVDVPKCVADVFRNNEREKKKLRERERAERAAGR